MTCLIFYIDWKVQNILKKSVSGFLVQQRKMLSNLYFCNLVQRCNDNVLSLTLYCLKSKKYRKQVIEWFCCIPQRKMLSKMYQLLLTINIQLWRKHIHSLTILLSKIAGWNHPMQVPPRLWLLKLFLLTSSKVQLAIHWPTLTYKQFDILLVKDYFFLCNNTPSFPTN